MSTRPDPSLTPATGRPLRPFYALGVLLDAEDFEAEQRYHRGRRARALQYLFGTGTVAGLSVVWRAATQQLTVLPGLALDQLGHTIEIPRPVSVRLRGGPRPDDAWFDMQLPDDLSGAVRDGNVIADVFVRAVVGERAIEPASSTGPFDELEAAEPARLRTCYEVALVLRPEASGPDPLPIPDDTAVLATRPPDRSAQLQWARERILAAWRDRPLDWQHDAQTPPQLRPRRLEEHIAKQRTGPTFPLTRELPSGESVLIRSDPTQVGRDPLSVLLARVRIPVDASVSPPRDLAADPLIDNELRRFVRGSGLYTQPGSGA